MHRLDIRSDWRGQPLDASEWSSVRFGLSGGRLVVDVEAPYADDPPPPYPPGSTEELWEYEVVELFLLSEATLGSGRERYLEIELSPHGHHLVLGFEGVRQRTAVFEPCDIEARIEGERWHAHVELDAAIVPEPPLRANAYRLHGADGARRYLAAHPVPGDAPDFHRIACFPALPELSTR